MVDAQEAARVGRYACGVHQWTGAMKGHAEVDATATTTATATVGVLVTMAKTATVTFTSTSITSRGPKRLLGNDVEPPQQMD